MRQSLDSARPILASDPTTAAPSTRYSTYSNPSMANTEKSSAGSLSTADPRVTDVSNYTTSLQRLESKELLEQRYVISPHKEDDMSKLALAGKVQRALDRRYRSQDAVFKPKKKGGSGSGEKSEKS